MRVVNLIGIVFLMTVLAGCSNFGKKMKAFISGKEAQPQVVQAVKPANFADNPNYTANTRRNYRRTTKKSFEDKSRVDAKSGSLWVMEGQGAYLFSENVVRMIGDALKVNIDGDPKEQLETKVSVIKNLLNKIEERKKALQQRRIASAKAARGKTAKGAEPVAKKEPTKVDGKAAEESDDPFKVKMVPTRIIERMVDGNYRIKGTRPFMIGRYEYNVIVTGIIRAEDFNEEGVSAAKLLDPKFDIVSSKRSGKRL